MERRQLLQTAAGLTGWLLLRPAQANTQLQDAVRAWAGGTPVQSGRVQIDIATVVDNGNTVPLSVRVDSPMTASDHVVAIAVFNERNPQADVLRCQLGPRAGQAQGAHAFLHRQLAQRAQLACGFTHGKAPESADGGGHERGERWAARREREHLVARGCDQHGVLPLRRQ